MELKERILDTALELFNKYGVENTSAKNIAAAMNISDGNLRYHFRTKEDIIYKLYLQLAEDFNQKLSQYETLKITLSDIYSTLTFVFTRLDAYKFLMTDFVVIMRKYPAVHTHYRQLYQYRKQQFSKFVNTLIEEGIFRKDITIVQYQHLAEHFTMLSDFWISSAEMLYEGEASEKVEKYIQLVFSLLLPYLTSKGVYEYTLVVNKS